MSGPQQTNWQIGLGLDWLDRAICIYLALPLVLFCFLFVPSVAALLFALTLFGSYHAICKGTADSIHLPRLLWFAIVALALIWTALSGVGHLFYANTDWIIRDAVLHDLIAAGGLPSYLPEGAAPLVLRAPIAYYLPAATVGHLFGQGIGQLCLFIWTLMGVALFLTSACRLFTTTAHRVVCLLVIILFSGMDLLGIFWRIGMPPSPGENIEWWLNIIQYPSNAYLLAWVPNHALPAWLATLLIIRHWRKTELAAITPLLAASIPLWSPLAAIGLFPFFLLGLRWKRDFSTLFSFKTCIPFVVPALVSFAYLTMGADTIRNGWFINAFDTTGAFLYSYALFCLLEFGVLTLILLRVTRFNSILYIAIAMLCLLPLYVYGPYNDIAMRSSIPSLLILALATVQPLANFKKSIWNVLLALVLGIGAVTAIQELIRPFLLPAWPALNQTLPDAVMTEHSWSPTKYPTHYLAEYEDHNITRWMRPPTATHNTHLSHSDK